MKRLRERVSAAGLGNIHLVEGVADDPKLPGNLDAVVMVMPYHEIAEPKKVLERVMASLRPGAVSPL